MAAKLSITPNPSFWATVALSVPGDKQVRLEVKFKHHTRSEIEELLTRLMKGESFADAAKQIVLDWKGDAIDADFSPENLALLFENYPASAREMMDAFQREEVGSKAKN